jgi:ABC-2 type transport system ATP-binding protein
MSETVLRVTGLCKRYPHFSLDHVSFSLPVGSISGFIGRNGAGKSTTLKSLLNLVHPEAGSIQFFGKDFSANELEIKQQISFVSGGISYYPPQKAENDYRGQPPLLQELGRGGLSALSAGVFSARRQNTC